MANTAFGHDATLTTPGSTTDTALVRWANTSGTSLNNTINILSDGSNITLNARGEVRFSDADSTHYIAFESPATVGTSYTMTLPADLPAADEVLTVTSYSGGAGVLEWAAAGGGAAQSPWTGNIDAANYQLLNVGNANSDWTSGVITIAAFAASNRTNLDSYRNAADGGAIQFRHSKSDTLGSHAALVANDDLGKIRFYGSGGSAFSIGAIIQAKATETFSNGSSNFGTKLEFYTTDNTTDTNDLRMTIDHDGEVTVKENASMPSVTKGIAKCWVEWEMTGAHGITASHNYTSVSDGGGAGDSDHVFATDFSSAGYAVAFGCEAHYYGTIGAKAAGTINPYVYNHAGTATDVSMSCLAAFGEQV